jgi:hypothetical protein
MGQAKRRGPFAQRLQEAATRNQVVKDNLPKMKPEVQAYAKRRGVHRLAVIMSIAGLVKTERKPPTDVNPPPLPN